jgi:predicted MFS family arabinose efflux permease
MSMPRSMTLTARGDSPSVRLLFAFLTTVGFLYANLLPVLIEALHRYDKFTLQSAGFIESVDLGAATFGSLLAALLPRLFDRRRGLLLAIVLVCCADLASTMAVSVQGLSVLRGFHGLVSGWIVAVSYAVTAERADFERIMALSLVIQLAEGALGFALIPPLEARWGAPAIFVVMAAATAAALPTALLCAQSGPKQKAESAPVPSLTVLHILLGISILVSLFVFQISRLAISSYILDIGQFFKLRSHNVDTILSIASIAAVIGALLAARFGLRFGYARPILVTTLINALCNVAMVFWGGSELVFASTNIVGLIALTFVIPYFFGVTSALDRSGRFAAWAAFIAQAGIAVAPWLGARLLQWGAERELIVIATVGGLCSTALGLWPAVALDRRSASHASPPTAVSR